MKPFNTLLLTFKDLTPTQQAAASNNGAGKEWANYLAVVRNGEIVYLESDAMEPEDTKFSRDLKWISEALQYAYSCGIADGRAQATTL